MHEASPDGRRVADEPLEADGIDVDEPRAAVLDPRRHGQRRFQQGVTRRQDVLLDQRSRHQHGAAGPRLHLRHARPHTLRAGLRVRLDDHRDLRRRGSFTTGARAVTADIDDAQRLRAQVGLAPFDGGRVEMLDEHAGEPAHAVHQSDSPGSSRRERSTRVLVRTRASRVGTGPGPAHSIPSRSVSIASAALDPVSRRRPTISRATSVRRTANFRRKDRAGGSRGTRSPRSSATSANPGQRTSMSAARSATPRSLPHRTHRSRRRSIPACAADRGSNVSSASTSAAVSP